MKEKKKKGKKKRTSQYWICDECAKAKGWEFPKWNVTCVMGLCGWCGRQDEAVLTPTCDFKRPGFTPVWD